MRETGAARLFVTRTDVIADIHGDDRRVVILNRDHAQAVRESRLFQIDVGITALRECDRRERQYKDEPDKL